MSKEKPESVDENAWWSPSDNEWLLAAKDGEGALHGLVTYWRPDGSLVNHCDYVHGTPHGSYKRYHQSGEISRQGTFVRGKLQGTDVFIRTESKSTENFPSGLSEAVWRAEMDMVNGSMVAGRLYNKAGQQVGEDGEPCPERPQSVPEEAVYSSTSGRWVLGETNDDYKREGVWHFYVQEGWVQQAIAYEAGEVTSQSDYANRFESEASIALDHENYPACELSIQDGLAKLTDESDALPLTALYVTCLDRQGKRREAVAQASEALRKYPVAAHWGRFMSSGQRAYDATARLQVFLANDHIDAGFGEEALSLARQAIANSTRQDANFYATKASALGLLGREDEKFSSLKTALGIDHEAPGLAEYKDDPKFAEWLKAIDPESMSEEGAWAILGEGGNAFDTFQGVLVADADDDDDEEAEDGTREPDLFDPEKMEICLDHPWDLSSLPNCSPELIEFAKRCQHIDIHDYRGAYANGCESTLTAAVGTIDGNWLARIQSIFLPGSVVNMDDESLVLASWHATAHGTSRTYTIHQDEAEFYHHSESLSAMIIGNLELGDEETEVTISQHTRNQWLAACSLTSEFEHFAPHFEVLSLEPRTHWIVNLLVGKNPDIISEIFLGEGLKTAATADDWEREKEFLQWPHLQAYWIVHHAVFANHAALAEVLEKTNPLYPGTSELAIFGKQLLAGEAIEETFWNPDRVLEYRLQSLEERPDLLSEEAKAQLLEDNKGLFAANATVKASLEELREDEENEGLVAFIEFLDSCAGSLDGTQEALSRQMEKSIDYFMSIKKGRVTPFEDVFARMDVLPERIEQKPEREAPLKALFEAAIARGCESPDDHSNVMAGDLYALGVLTINSPADFDAFYERVQGMAFYPEKFGRFRRLQIAMLAAVHQERSEIAKSFLKQEAARFAEQADEWKSDTFDFADRTLAASGDEDQLRAMNQRFIDASFSGANWKESIDIARRLLAAPSPLMAEGLSAAVEKGLGRHDDGERAIVVRAYARCAGTLARETIERWLANIKDVRTDCETAALLAGLIEVDVGTDALAQTLDKAHHVLGSLTNGSMKVGAAVALMQTIHDHGIAGFADDAKTVNKNAAAEKYVKDELKEWMEANKDSFES